MRPSVMPVIFAAVLLFEGYALSVALPLTKTEENSLEQDALTSLLSDEVMENSLGDVADADKTKNQRVIVIASPSLWRDLRMHGGLSLYKRRADDGSPVMEHRAASQDLSIPILRRDSTRCMVGRVYRPCWEV